MNLGQVLVLGHRFSEAATTFEHAVNLAPDLTQFRVLLGAALVSDDRPEDALPHLLRAVEERPDLALTHTNLGTAWQALNRLTDALACYEAALTIYPRTC